MARAGGIARRIHLGEALAAARCSIESALSAVLVDGVLALDSAARVGLRDQRPTGTVATPMTRCSCRDASRLQRLRALVREREFYASRRLPLSLSG